MNEYYKLKSMYEKKIISNKKKILEQDLPINEKKKKIRDFQPKCVKCKNVGGTLFSNKGGVLKATCNSITSCGLDITINKGNHIDCRKLYLDALNEEKRLIQEIIKIKMDVLFKYTNKSETTAAFNELKRIYDENNKKLTHYQDTYISIKDNLENKEEIETLNSLIDDTMKEIEFNVDDIDSLVKNNKYLYELHSRKRVLTYRMYNIETCKNNYDLKCPEELYFLNKEFFTTYDCLIETSKI